MKIEHMSESYSADDFIRGTKREAKELIRKHVKRTISANDIKEKTPEWYLLIGLITSVDEDKS